MPVKEIEQMITIGSKYRIVSQGGNDEAVVSTGEFRGYAAFANETALVLKLDESHGADADHVRFLPYHAILLIDVITLAPKDVQEAKEDKQVYYG